MNKNFENLTNNYTYNDGFPVNDNSTKIDDIKSKDTSRPFDSGRSDEIRVKKMRAKNYNSSGTTMNEKNKFHK